MGRGAGTETELSDTTPRDAAVAKATVVVEESLVGLAGVSIADAGVETDGRYAGRAFVEIHFEHSGHAFHGFRRLRKHANVSGRNGDDEWHGTWFIAGEDRDGHGVRLYPILEGE